MVDQFEGMLEEYSPDVQAISRALRAIIQKDTPGAIEEISTDQKHLSYAPSIEQGKQIIVLAPKKTFVFLVFKDCKQLEDSENLLGSSGKQTRFMAVKSLEEANRPALSQLIESAWKMATTS